MIIKQDNITHEEWLENRKKGLGGSDAGAVLGFNKYTSPFKLFLEKTGEYKEELDSEAAYFGNVLEEVVRQEFIKRTGKNVVKTNDLYVHDEYQFMQANVDGWLPEENAILECKTVSEYLKSEWDGEEVPASYLCQVHHYMAVTGAERAYFAALIGGNKFVWKVIEKNLEFERMLIEQEKWFWEECVLKGNPPPMDGQDSTVSLMSDMYPEDDGSEIMMSKEEELIIDALEVIKEEIKNLDQQKKKYENILKNTLKNSKIGHTQRHKVVYSTYNQKRIDSTRLKEEQPELFEEYSKESTVRKMNIKKLEEK